MQKADGKNHRRGEHFQGAGTFRVGNPFDGVTSVTLTNVLARRRSMIAVREHGNSGSFKVAVMRYWQPNCQQHKRDDFVERFQI